MPTGFAAHRCRRAPVLIAAWLVVLQAFLAGVATAQAGAMLASDPIEVICHGSGGADPADSTTPDRAKVWHLCCAACMSAAAAMAPPDAPTSAASEPRRAARPFAYSRFIVVISPGAIRAGRSQAPPTSA